MYQFQCACFFNASPATPPSLFCAQFHCLYSVIIYSITFNGMPEFVHFCIRSLYRGRTWCASCQTSPRCLRLSPANPLQSSNVSRAQSAIRFASRAGAGRPRPASVRLKINCEGIFSMSGADAGVSIPILSYYPLQSITTPWRCNYWLLIAKRAICQITALPKQAMAHTLLPLSSATSGQS